MSKVFRIVILLVFPFSVIAQNADSLKWKKFGVLYDQPFNKVQPQQIVSLSSSQELFTSKISNDFVYPFLKGDNLDRSTINRTIDRSGSKWVGVMQQTELSWINLKKGIGSKKKLHLYLKAGNYAKTFAELSFEEKNKISHRRLALDKMLEHFTTREKKIKLNSLSY